MRKAAILGLVMCAGLGGDAVRAQCGVAAPTQFGLSYYEFVAGNVSWETAKLNAATCTFTPPGQLARHGHLVAISTADENDFIRNTLLTGGAIPWIGATDEVVTGITAEGDFRWVTGEEFWAGGAGGSAQNGLYANWAAGRPDNAGGNQHYAVMLAAGTWDDETLNSAVPTGYVVEFSLLQTKTYTIVGNGDNTEWNWRLTRDNVPICGDLNVGPVGVAEPCDTVTSTQVNSVNSVCGACRAAVVGGGCGMRVRCSRLIATGGSNFAAWVTDNPTDDPQLNGCEVPLASQGNCNFNPTIAEDDPPPASATIPTLTVWHYVAFVLLIAGAGGFLLWRRPLGT